VRGRTTRVPLLEVLKFKTMYSGLEAWAWWFVYAGSAGLHRFREISPHKSGLTWGRVTQASKVQGTS